MHSATKMDVRGSDNESDGARQCSRAADCAGPHRPKGTSEATRLGAGELQEGFRLAFLEVEAKTMRKEDVGDDGGRGRHFVGQSVRSCSINGEGAIVDVRDLRSLDRGTGSGVDERSRSITRQLDGEIGMEDLLSAFKQNAKHQVVEYNVTERVARFRTRPSAGQRWTMIHREPRVLMMLSNEAVKVRGHLSCGKDVLTGKPGGKLMHDFWREVHLGHEKGDSLIRVIQRQTELPEDRVKAEMASINRTAALLEDSLECSRKRRMA